MTDDSLRMLRQDFWDERYGTPDRIWSGRANPHLVSGAGDLVPERALDVGCGEGADAIWLARHGWEVIAIDVSPVALEKGARIAAAEAGAEAAARISWRQADVLSWGPEPGAFDLVSAQFMHLPPEPREALFARLADGVALGGTLLVVGHHPDTHGGAHPGHAAMLYTAEELVASLDPGEWEIVRADAPDRVGRGPDGTQTPVRDARLQARRR